MAPGVLVLLQINGLLYSRSTATPPTTPVALTRHHTSEQGEPQPTSAVPIVRIEKVSTVDVQDDRNGWSSLAVPRGDRYRAASGARAVAGPALRVRLPSGNRRTVVVVDEVEASGQAWRDEVRRRVAVEQDRAALARLVELDADPFEVELYESICEPRELLIDRAQRSRAGQYERHVRRLRQRRAHRDC